MPTRTIDSLHLDTVETPTPFGAPVLCLHGLFAGSWVFEGLLPLIAARGYPAAALSFRGHPPNVPMTDIGRRTISDFCEDAAVAARALGRPIVIGHSLGGLVAQMLAARDLVRAAILIAPSPPRGISVLSPPVLARMARYVPALLFSRPFLFTQRHADALALNRLTADARPQVWRRLVPDSGRAAREAALGVVTVAAADVHIPMLVIGCEFDRFIPRGICERIARHYAATFHLARGHGHFLFGEPDWEREANVMLDWIDGLPADVRLAHDDHAASSGEPKPARAN